MLGHSKGLESSLSDSDYRQYNSTNSLICHTLRRRRLPGAQTDSGPPEILKFRVPCRTVLRRLQATTVVLKRYDSCTPTRLPHRTTSAPCRSFRSDRESCQRLTIPASASTANRPAKRRK